MFAWVHRRLREEEGISLVEVLVSIVLLGLVLAAFGNTLFASMASARQNEGMTQATAVANEQLEKLNAMTWLALDPASPPVLPPVTRDGITYTVSTEVAAIAPQYKSYAVELDWTADGRAYNVRVEGRRARRSGDSTSTPPTNPFRVLSYTINPDPVNLDSTGKSLAATNPTLPGNAAMLLEVELSEAARTNSVIASWPFPSPTTTLTLTEVAGSAGKKFSGTIASGQTYNAGWMTFRVTAARSGTTTTCTASPLPNSPNCADSTSAAYLMAPISNGPLYYDSNNQRLYTGTPGPAGDRMCLNSSTQRLRNTNPFYLGLKGLGVDDTVTLVRTDVDPDISFEMEWTKVAQNWWWYGAATASGSGTFTPGVNSTWEIRWIRTYDSLSSTIPLTFFTQNANGNSAC